MAQIPFSKLNASTFRDAVRKSIQEVREPGNEAEKQLESARSRGLTIVTHLRTGRKGWLTQELNYGFHLRVRWAGVAGRDAVTRERVEDIVELDV